MPAADRDQGAGVIRQSIEHEVAIGSERVKAGLGIDDRPQGAGDMSTQEVAHPAQRRLVRFEGPGLGRHFPAAGILPRLGAGLTEDGKAVEARVVHPDPDGETAGLEILRPRAGKVGYLLLSDRQWQTVTEGGQRRVGPGASRHYQPAAADSVSSHVQFYFSVPWANRPDVSPFPKHRTMRTRHPLMCGVGSSRHGYAALLLIEAVNVVRNLERRPPAHDLPSVECLVGHASRRHALGVLTEGYGADPAAEVQSPGPKNQLLACILLHFRPGVVGVLGQLDISRGVVGEPDDSGMILRLSPNVAQLELFQAEHLGTGSPGQPVRRGAAEATQPQNHVLVVLLHGLPLPASSGGSFSFT